MSRFLAVMLPAPPPHVVAALAPVFERYSDRVQLLPPWHSPAEPAVASGMADEAGPEAAPEHARWLLDLAGMESALGPAPQIAARLGGELAARGLEAGLGLGPTRTAALLLAATAGGRPQGACRVEAVEVPDPAPALAALPIAVLAALDGYGPEAAACCALFQRWGLRRLGEVARLPARALSERLGRAGLNCQRWARGQDVGLLAPAPSPPAPTELTTHFEPALEGYLPLVPWLEVQLRQQAAHLAARDRAWASAALQLTLDGPQLHNEAPGTGEGAGGAFTEPSGRALPPSESRPPPDARGPHGACALGWEQRNGVVRRAAASPPAPWTWRQCFALPHRDPRRLLAQIETALAQQPPTAPIRAARLELEPTAPRRVQSGLFGDARQQSEPLDHLAARLRALLDDPGGQRCGSPCLLDLHRRDRFYMAPFAAGAAAAAAAAPAFTRP
ncbi:MAG: hypothetical protein ACRD01_03665, partial [Terriglobales bacterium]